MGRARQPRLAFASADRIEAVQTGLLRDQAAYSASQSPFYRRRLGGDDAALGELTLETLARLPFTDKRDLEQHNDEFLAVPRNRVADIVLSSGTTGKPTRIMYTEGDLQRLAYNEEQAFRGCGLGADDVVLLTCTLDRCFVAGLAYFLGVRSIGAAAIRNGLNSLESHFNVIRQMRPTAIVGVPSFLRKLALHIRDGGGDPAAAGVGKLICIGEPLRGPGLEMLQLGGDIERLWAARAFSTYASSECVSTFCECAAQCGGHAAPDLVVAEVVDEQGRRVPDGETGEVVLTPLGAEAMPLIRFRTGDVSYLLREPCACGRRSVRLGPILGRKQQMIKARGTTLYPQALYSALDEIPAVSEYYIEVTSPDRLSDEVTVHAAVRDASCSAAWLEERLQSRVRVKPRVTIESEEQIRAQVFGPKSRKPVRFVDRR
jgi:phenylacetate-CoA ligase